MSIQLTLLSPAHSLVPGSKEPLDIVWRVNALCASGVRRRMGSQRKGREQQQPARRTKEVLLGMDSGGFLWDEFSELLLRKGTESFLCYDSQELDGEIKGALIESDGIFKREKPLGVRER